jgi:acetyl-CoA carboxylase biotin carboxyl carrier protein
MSKQNSGEIKLPVSAIRELSEILKEQNLTEIEVENDHLGKIRVRKEISVAAGANLVAANSNPTSQTSQSVSFATNLFEVKSPMVGTYYASPSPDAEPFIKAGSKVKKGDTLCIVEAMKLMNELPSEIEGEIAEICVTNGQSISFGQVLMKIKKS